MVRLSDILRQKGQVPEPERPGRKREESVSSGLRQKETEGKVPEGAQISRAMEAGKPEAEKEMQMAKTMHELQLDPEESVKIYNQSLEIIKNIFEQRKKSPATLPDLREAYEIVKVIVDRLVLGDKELVSLTIGFTEDNYLYGHLVNVCILSLDIGLSLGYNKSKLNELGLGAFIHDLGMAEVMDLVKQPRKLNELEFIEVKKHPIYGSDLLSTVKSIQDGVTYIVKQEHERMNGSGYPAGLKDDQIHEYAKIVAIVDVYEALVHPRAHREALSPHEAIKELLSMNTQMLFENKILKILINRIGLYPAGCWVELNTGEIGKVVYSNPDVPLRPNVNVVFGPDKQELPQKKSIDLFRHTNIFIKRSINPSELNLKL